jgi:hypothetical protein
MLASANANLGDGGIPIVVDARPPCSKGDAAIDVALVSQYDGSKNPDQGATLNPTKHSDEIPSPPDPLLRRRALLRMGGPLLAGGIAAGSLCHAADQDPAKPSATGPVVLGAAPPDTQFEIYGNDRDTTTLWERALAGIEKGGGGSIRAYGVHRLSAGLALPDVASLEIVGCGCVLRKEGSETEFPFFRGPSGKAANRILILRNLHLIGDWDQRSAMGSNASRGIAVSGYHKVVFAHLHLEGIRQMGLTAGYCDEVFAHGCTIERNARDGMNFTGSRFVTVSGCTIRHCYDDAIAVHCVHKNTNPAAKYGTVITGNQIEDSFGIKVLGGENIIVAHNNIMRPKLYGVYLGKDSHYQEGLVPHRSVIIQGNLISDVIRREYLQVPHELNEGIIFVDSGREIHSTLIVDNVITKSKPSGPGVHYSDWGYGKLFMADGWRDPELKEPHAGAGRGIRIMAANADDAEEIVIAGNHISGIAPQARIQRSKRT